MHHQCHYLLFLGKGLSIFVPYNFDTTGEILFTLSIHMYLHIFNCYFITVTVIQKSLELCPGNIREIKNGYTFAKISQYWSKEEI